MTESQFDKILDKLPHGDGSARRRLVAGSVVGLGLLIVFWKQLEAEFGDLTVGGIIARPFLIASIALMTYAIGNTVEVVGEIFLVRLYGRLLSLLGFGRIGLSGYSIRWDRLLDSSVKAYYEHLPAHVSYGFSNPVAAGAESAFRAVLGTFRSDREQRWGYKLLSRARDVSAVTTALFVVAATAAVFNVDAFTVATAQENRAERATKSLDLLRATISDAEQLAEERRRQVERLDKQIDVLRSQSIDEATGTGPSGVPGHGPGFQMLQDDIVRLEAVRDSARKDADRTRTELEIMRTQMAEAEAKSADIRSNALLQTTKRYLWVAAGITLLLSGLYIGYFASLVGALMNILHAAALADSSRGEAGIVRPVVLREAS